MKEEGEFRREKKEDHDIASMGSKVRGIGGERARVRAHGTNARRGVSKASGDRSLGRVGGEEDGWCVDTGEGEVVCRHRRGHGGRGDVGRLGLCLSLRREKEKEREKKKRKRNKKKREKKKEKNNNILVNFLKKFCLNL